MAWHGHGMPADAVLVVRQQTHDRAVPRAPSLLCSPPFATRGAGAGWPPTMYSSRVLHVCASVPWHTPKLPRAIEYTYTTPRLFRRQVQVIHGCPCRHEIDTGTVQRSTVLIANGSGARRS